LAASPNTDGRQGWVVVGHPPAAHSHSASISFAWSARNAFSMVSRTGPSSAPLAFAWIRSITRRSSRHDRPQYSSAGDPTVETYRASWPLNLVGRDWRIPYQGGRQGPPGRRDSARWPHSHSPGRATHTTPHDYLSLTEQCRLLHDFRRGFGMAKETSRSLGRWSRSTAHPYLHAGGRVGSRR